MHARLIKAINRMCVSASLCPCVCVCVRAVKGVYEGISGVHVLITDSNLNQRRLCLLGAVKVSVHGWIVRFTKVAAADNISSELQEKASNLAGLVNTVIHHTGNKRPPNSIFSFCFSVLILAFSHFFLPPPPPWSPLPSLHSPFILFFHFSFHFFYPLLSFFSFLLIRKAFLHLCFLILSLNIWICTVVFCFEYSRAN